MHVKIYIDEFKKILLTLVVFDVMPIAHATFTFVQFCDKMHLALADTFFSYRYLSTLYGSFAIFVKINHYMWE